jgi:hypothetical protein
MAFCMESDYKNSTNDKRNIIWESKIINMPQHKTRRLSVQTSSQNYYYCYHHNHHHHHHCTNTITDTNTETSTTGWNTFTVPSNKRTILTSATSDLITKYRCPSMYVHLTDKLPEKKKICMSICLLNR